VRAKFCLGRVGGWGGVFDCWLTLWGFFYFLVYVCRNVSRGWLVLFLCICKNVSRDWLELFFCVCKNVSRDQLELFFLRMQKCK